jgi:FAD/FMN-containing dehydrogenase
MNGLAQLLGERVTLDPGERAYYRRDLAAVPGFLGALIGHTMPDAIARPRDTADVVALVRYAAEHHLPITPRAAATTVYWNAVPVKRGIVVDMNGMRGLLGIDESRMVASVLPGTRWQELEQQLQHRGFALLSYPTSAPSATVAGWLSMEGYGIGSLKYGGLEQQIDQIEVVLPDGRVVQAGPTGEFPISVFAGAEGTLGIMTRIDLRIRRAPARSTCMLLAFPEEATLHALLPRLAALTPAPFCIHFADAKYQRMLRSAGFEPPCDQPLAMITFEGSEAEVAEGIARTRELLQGSATRILDDEVAAREWSERFLALRLKRVGPTVLGAESWLALDRLPEYAAEVGRLARHQRLDLATYGTVVKPDQATVMSLFPCDEGRVLDYVMALSLTRKVFGAAFHYGGRPYGVGVWSTPYLRYAYARAELTALRARKRQMDPLNIMNPGKLYAPPFLLSPLVFGLGMGTLAGVRRLLKAVS